MASGPDESRRSFLEAAARYYLSLAPATSAHLMSQCKVDALDGKAPVYGGKPDIVCKACGTVLIPGWTSKTTITKKKRSLRDQEPSVKNRPRKRAPRSRVKFLRVDCLKCYRFLEEPLAQSQPKSSNLPRVTNPQATSSAAQKRTSPSTVSQHPPRSTASNAGSKQRAKARKYGGLQAMLERSKAPASFSSGFGLDLLDLMKQG